MTTYTINEQQRLEAMDALYLPSMKTEAMLKQKDKAYVMLQSLQPNTQEPIGYAVPTFGFDNSVIRAVQYANTVALYDHPAPQKPRELTNDELWTVWDDYYSDTASYDRQSFDVAFLRAVLEAAHNIGVKP